MKAVLCLVILTAACGRKPALEPGRLVVLRFENLSGNPALDWTERGAPRQIAAQIKGSTPADAYQPGEARARAIAAGGRQILHGYVLQSGDRLRLHAEVEDAVSGKFARSADATGAASAGLVALADAVARQLESGASPPATRQDAAMEAYIRGLESSSSGAAAELFSRSMAADPDFGLAYLALIELNLARKDRSGAERALAMARARGDSLSSADRARLDVTAAQISGNAAALSQSLAALSRLTPTDTKLLRALADVELAAKRYPTAIEYFKKALAEQPGDAALLNSLGYAQAYAGDLDGAVKTLREYERLRPAEANPLDSLGDVHFYWGRFSEAGQFYRHAYQKDATFLNSASLVKAAKAQLMTGDPPGADSIFAEYEKARRAANDPMIGFARAQWDYLRGKHSAAIRDLGTFAASTKIREAAALADCTLTVWLLESGDRAAAAKHTACRFLTDPGAASFPNPATQAYALLLANDFQRALPILRELAPRMAPNPTEVAPVLLAWALVETGHFDEAEKYLRTIPVPAVPSPAPFDSLIFPRIFQLRAKVAEKKGDRAGADRNLRLFKALTNEAQSPATVP